MKVTLERFYSFFASSFIISLKNLAYVYSKLFSFLHVKGLSIETLFILVGDIQIYGFFKEGLLLSGLCASPSSLVSSFAEPGEEDEFDEDDVSKLSSSAI